MTKKTWKVKYETSKVQFIKWTISGELPIGLESHQDTWFWSNKQLFWEGYYGRPCMLFKVHKAHQEGSAPPEWPVISGSGSITENPSKFCQHYMKQVSKDHASFFRDTFDFLRHIQNIENLLDNAILAHPCPHTHDFQKWTYMENFFIGVLGEV